MNQGKQKMIGKTLLTLGLSLTLGMFLIAKRLDEGYYYVSQETEGTLMLFTLVGVVCTAIGLVLCIASKFTVNKDKLVGDLLQNQEPSSVSTKCHHCGLELADNLDVCPNCGAKVEHLDSVDIVQLVKNAENGGKRTAVAIRVSGDLVPIQEKINQYLQNQGYTKSQTALGEQVWMNTLGRMIKYEFVPGYMILSGCLSGNGVEMNLEGMVSALWKKKVAKDMDEIGKLVKLG